MMVGLATFSGRFLTQASSAKWRRLVPPAGTHTLIRVLRKRTPGHLIYCTNEHRIQRQDLVLEGTRPMVLRYCSGGAEPRPESDIRNRDLWLGSDSSACSNRQNRVADFLVSQRRTLPCAHQGKCSKSRKT